MIFSIKLQHKRANIADRKLQAKRYWTYCGCVHIDRRVKPTPSHCWYTHYICWRPDRRKEKKNCIILWHCRWRIAARADNDDVGNVISILIFFCFFVFLAYNYDFNFVNASRARIVVIYNSKPLYNFGAYILLLLLCAFSANSVWFGVLFFFCLCVADCKYILFFFDFSFINH